MCKPLKFFEDNHDSWALNHVCRFFRRIHEVQRLMRRLEHGIQPILDIFRSESKKSSCFLIIWITTPKDECERYFFRKL